MALFSDGDLSTLAGLAGHDSQLLGVASTEGIDVTLKMALAAPSPSARVPKLTSVKPGVARKRRNVYLRS